MARYFIVSFFMCLLFFAGCTNLQNDPAIQEWKDFHTSILMSDAISGMTWEAFKLYEVRANIPDTKFAINDIDSMHFKKADDELNKILQEATLRAKRINKVVTFLQNKGINKDVIARYNLVLSINKQTSDIAKLTANILNGLKTENKINTAKQDELNKLRKQLTALDIRISPLIAKWLKDSRSNPDTLIRKTFPEYFKSSILAYGSHKFYKTVDSYIENGELLIDKIIKFKKNMGRWARKDEIKFNNWQYSTKDNSFVLWRSVDLLGPNKFILRYVYSPIKPNGWYLEFLESRKSSFMKTSPIIEKYKSSIKRKKI